MNNFLPIDKLWNWKSFVVLAALSTYISATFFLYGNSKVIVPDEMLFLYHVNHLIPSPQNLKEWIYLIWHQPNHLGYGSAFWLLLKILPSNSDIQVHFFRGLFLFLWLIFFSILLKKNKLAFLYSFAFFLVSGPAWWYGKIVSPELISVLIGSIGILIVTNFPTCSFILFGIAIGFKITNVIFPFFCFFLLNNYRLSFLFRIAAAGVLGFLLTNPIFLIDQVTFYKTLMFYKNPPNFTFSHLKYILTDSHWEWDNIYSGGLFIWVVNPISLAGLLIFSYLQQQFRLLFGLLATIAFYFIILLSNSRFLGWYWLPCFYIFVIAFHQIASKIKTKTIHIILAFIIIIQALFSFSQIQDQIKDRIALKSNISQTEKINDCIRNSKIIDLHPQMIIDFFELEKPLNYGPQSESIPIYFGWSAYDFISRGSDSEIYKKHGKLKTLITLSRRLRSHHPYEDFLFFTNTSSTFQNYTFKTLVYECEEVDFFLLE